MAKEQNNWARNTLITLMITLILTSLSISRTAHVKASDIEKNMQEKQEAIKEQQTKIMIDVEIVKTDISYIKKDIAEIKQQQQESLEEIKRLIQDRSNQ